MKTNLPGFVEKMPSKHEASLMQKQKLPRKLKKEIRKDIKKQMSKGVKYKLKLEKANLDFSKMEFSIVLGK